MMSCGANCTQGSANDCVGDCFMSCYVQCEYFGCYGCTGTCARARGCTGKRGNCQGNCASGSSCSATTGGTKLYFIS